LLSNVRKEVDRLNKLHIQFLSKSGVELFPGWGRFTGPNSISIRKSDDKQDNLELSAKHILVAVGGQPIRPDIEGASLGWVSDDMFLQQTYPEKVIIIGEESNIFYKYFRSKVSTVYVDKLDKAVNEMSKFMKTNTDFNTFLFSPGAASFDQYNNFEERGRHFNKLISKIT